MQQPMPESDPKPLKIKPQRGWYLLALFITIVGPLWAILSISHTLRKDFDTTIELPKSINEFTVSAPGTYTLFEAFTFPWNTLHAQNVFTTQEQFPSELYKFHLIGQDTNKPKPKLETIPMHPWIRIAWGDSLQFFIGRAQVTFDAPGKFVMTLNKPETSKFLLAQPNTNVLYKSILANVGLLISTMIFGPLLLLSVFFLRQSNRRLLLSPEYASIEHKKDISQIRTVAALIHNGGLFGYFFPLGQILTPILFYFMFGQRHPILRSNLRSVLNFQISMTFCLLASLILFLIVGSFFGSPSLIFLLAFFLLAFLHIALTLLGVIMSFKDGYFIYPLSIKFFHCEALVPNPRSDM